MTSWAAIIAVLRTLITGWYWDERPVPRLRPAVGGVAGGGAGALLSGGLYVIFRRKDWL